MAAKYYVLRNHINYKKDACWSEVYLKLDESGLKIIGKKMIKTFLEDEVLTSELKEMGEEKGKGIEQSFKYTSS